MSHDGGGGEKNKIMSQCVKYLLIGHISCLKKLLCKIYFFAAALLTIGDTQCIHSMNKHSNTVIMLKNFLTTNIIPLIIHSP